MNRPTAYNYALNLLSARPYATSALHRKLIQKEYTAADADDAIRRLVSAGLLDDEKYAEQYARSKILGTGASKRRLTQELYRKNNINPLGGCLPLFLQMPVFIGLYRALLVDVELRQSPLLLLCSRPP